MLINNNLKHVGLWYSAEMGAPWILPGHKIKYHQKKIISIIIESVIITIIVTIIIIIILIIIITPFSMLQSATILDIANKRYSTSPQRTQTHVLKPISFLDEYISPCGEHFVFSLRIFKFVDRLLLYHAANIVFPRKSHFAAIHALTIIGMKLDHTWLISSILTIIIEMTNITENMKHWTQLNHWL